MTEIYKTEPGKHVADKKNQKAYSSLCLHTVWCRDQGHAKSMCVIRILQPLITGNMIRVKVLPYAANNPAA